MSVYLGSDDPDLCLETPALKAFLIKRSQFWPFFATKLTKYLKVPKSLSDAKIGRFKESQDAIYIFLASFIQSIKMHQREKRKAF